MEKFRTWEPSGGGTIGHCALTASRRAHALTVAAVLILVIALSGGFAAASAASPTVSGPVTGGAGVPQPPNLNGFDLAQVGYQQSEYFLSGTASAYTPSP